MGEERGVVPSRVVAPEEDSCPIVDDGGGNIRASSRRTGVDNDPELEAVCDIAVDVGREGGGAINDG